MIAGRHGPDESGADADAFGLALEAPTAVCDVWPENLESLQLFLGLATQWRVDGMSGATLGLDYTAVESYLRLNGIDDPGQAFADIQVMELAALGVMNSKPGTAHG